ncbi:sporulation integral membrane protein YlbJ [Dethiothermospora halolimnae]|uniref:sporulation integral membrane protein YlbJ n=1 Tax=Dethiothermospora halolimnae TaxID=3114390 RepID=UPI003CCC38F2
MDKLIYCIISIIIIFFVIYFLKSKLRKYYKEIKTYLIIAIVLWLTITIVLYPKESVKAAKDGLYTWFNVVLPSLLPFFIGAEILIGLGVVNFLGSLLQPLMKPIFNVPGEGAFPFVMSITSGYPVGAKMVSKLRIQSSVSQVEAQRLTAFCSTSGPLFMIGAVAVGMFKNSSIGPLIAIAHYLGAISVGILFRFYKRKENIAKNNSKNFNMKNSFNELIKARQEDGRPLGILMGDAVKEGFNSMVMVGGFIILYSVVIEVLDITNILNYISRALSILIPTLQNTEIIKGILSGIIEMTNGCKMISEIESTSLIVKISAASFLIGWSGFSIHSQAMTMLGKTDIKNNVYFFSKLVHGILSSFFTIILYKFIFKNHVVITSSDNLNNKIVFSSSWISKLTFSIKIQISILIIMILIGTLTTLTVKLIKEHK